MKLIYDKTKINDAVLRVEWEDEGKKHVILNKYIATILLPAELKFYFTNATVKTPIGKYLKILLHKYKTLLLTDEIGLKKCEKLNTGFQEKGLELEKISFQVEAEVWAELKMLKLALNWSVCRIVSFLVYLDSVCLLEDLPESVAGIVVPKSPDFYFIGRFYFHTKKPTLYRRTTFIRNDYS
jgi:hypothetical protein